MSMKNYIVNIGNRTRDLPACSAMPQTTAPPRALLFAVVVSACSEDYPQVIGFIMPSFDTEIHSIQLSSSDQER